MNSDGHDDEENDEPVGPRVARPGSEDPEPSVSSPGGEREAEQQSRLEQLKRRWQRREGETAKAFTAARVYFDLGHERNIRTVAQMCRKSLSLIARWSSQHDWVERARDYDAYLAEAWEDSQLREIQENSRKWARRREEAREADWLQSQQLRATVERTIQEFLRYPTELGLQDAIEALVVASQLARDAVDPPLSSPHATQTPPPRQRG